jgi:hypothetical protein
MTMKALTILAVAGALALGGCQTMSFAEYAAAANTLDPDCDKDVTVTATPMLIFGFPVPVIAGEYRKSCKRNPQAPVQPTPALQSGGVLTFQ